MRIYDLLDTKASEYTGALMLAHNDQVIKRMLKNAASRTMPHVVQDPGDFMLMCLGAIDLHTGVIASSSPVPVASMATILRGPDSDLFAAPAPTPPAGGE